MVFTRGTHLVWIIGGLCLSLFVWGGLGSTTVASSGVPENPFSISTTRARLEPGPFLASRSLGIDATETPNPETRTYVVEPGDTLWTIAAKFYGSGAKYPLIQRANDLPDNARLRAGQVLVIPSLEAEKTPTPQTPTRVAATPSPAPNLRSPTPTPSPSAVIPKQPPAAVTPVDAPDSSATPSDSGIVVVIPILGMVVNVLGVICLIGSFLCAVMSYDIYRRSLHYARRRQIGNRVRSGL